MGLVQYLSSFLPDITAYMGPLLAMTQNGNVFNWRPIHQRCFDMIKATCHKTLILHPIDPRKAEPIWVVCDASKSGIGTMYGQGESWQTCCPAGFMSKKFMATQHNYRVHKLEMLGILEALLKWEDKLIGYRIHVITDHKALEFFKTQSHLTGCQMRWMDYLSRFDFDITYIKGENNKVADCLSRYYESDERDKAHSIHEYVTADSRIDPTGDDLPPDRFMELREHVVEIRAMQEDTWRQSCQLQERVEMWDIEAKEMQDHPPDLATDDGQPTSQAGSIANNELTIEDLLNAGPAIENYLIEEDSFLQDVKLGYDTDPVFKLILDSPGDYLGFKIEDGIIRTKNRSGEMVVCIP